MKSKFFASSNFQVIMVNIIKLVSKGCNLVGFRASEISD